MSTAEAKAKWMEEFDRMGEDLVRRRVATGQYNGTRLHWANEWLAKFDQDSRLRNEASQTESLEAAKAAADAARDAARYAKHANVIAILALIAAAIAIGLPFLIGRSN